MKSQNHEVLEVNHTEKNQFGQFQTTIQNTKTVLAIVTHRQEILKPQELSFFNLDNKIEYVMKNIKKNQNGYVPHFNLGYTKTTVRFKKIVLSHYSTI